MKTSNHVRAYSRMYSLANKSSVEQEHLIRWANLVNEAKAKKHQPNPCNRFRKSRPNPGPSRQEYIHRDDKYPIETNSQGDRICHGGGTSNLIPFLFQFTLWAMSNRQNGLISLDTLGPEIQRAEITPTVMVLQGLHPTWIQRESDSTPIQSLLVGVDAPGACSWLRK